MFHYVPLGFRQDCWKIWKRGRSENILHQKSVGDFAKDCGTPMNKIHPVTAHQFNEIFERVYFGPGRVLCGFVTHDIRHRSSSIALVYWNTCWWSTLKSDCFLHVRLCPVSVVYFFQAQKPRDCCMYRVALCFVAQVLIASHGLVFWATTIMEDCGFNMAQQPQQLQLQSTERVTDSEMFENSKKCQTKTKTDTKTKIMKQWNSSILQYISYSNFRSSNPFPCSRHGNSVQRDRGNMMLFVDFDQQDSNSTRARALTFQRLRADGLFKIPW